MLKSSLCEYSEAFRLVKRTITFVGQEADASVKVANRNNQ